MIYYADTITLMKKYAKEDPEVIKKTNFIIISSRIKVTKEYENVLMASNMFINSGMLKGVGMELDSDSELAKEKFKFFLLREPKSLDLIISTVQAFLVADENTLFLCSPNELRSGYMQIIAETIEDLLHFPVCLYPEERSFDLEDVLERLLYYKKEVKRLHRMKMRPAEVRRYVTGLSKKKVKKELKHRKLDYDGLDLDEMRKLLEDNFKEG